MKPKSIIVALVMLPVMLGLNGCIHTHSDVVISQPKPLQVDVNLNGKLTLVIQDARNDMQYIAGAPPAGPSTAPAGVATVPATLPTAAPQAAPTTTPAATKPSSLRMPNAADRVVIFADDIPPAQMTTKQQVLAELREDYPHLRVLLIKHLIGEAHTGYVEARGALTAKQKKLIHEDNAYRQRLYQIVGKSTGQSVATVGLIYFQVRLRYLPDGVWVQQLNNSTGQWVWIKWVR